MKSKKKLILPLAIIIFMFLTMRYSETASEKAFVSMQTAIQKIIPSLFPYMVISSLIVSSGAAEILGRLLPVSTLFSLPQSASTPIILGALCGFPLGAKSASELYQNGYISKTEAEVLISIANNTGPTFLIFVIGNTIWRNLYFGIFLYIAQLISAFIAALLINKWLFPFKSKNVHTKTSVIIKPFLTSFTDAIRSAALSSLYICGFITFFSVVSSIISNIFIFLPEKAMAMINALLEFTEASSSAADIGGAYGAFVCGYAVGWSGLSVFFQTSAFTTPLGLSLKRCIIVKALQGLLLGSSVAIYFYITEFDNKLNIPIDLNHLKIIPIILICFILSAIYAIYHIKKRKCA